MIIYLQYDIESWIPDKLYLKENEMKKDEKDEESHGIGMYITHELPVCIYSTIVRKFKLLNHWTVPSWCYYIQSESL